MKTLGKSEHDFLGSEFDWISQDKNGKMGYFSTAGEGWIPESTLHSNQIYWDVLDLVISLPIVGDPECTFSGNHSIDDWINVAARGFFAFDWNRGTKQYELVARPTGIVAAEGIRKIKKFVNPAILQCSFETDFSFRGPTA